MLQFAEAAGNSELVIEARIRRVFCLLELGNMQAVAAELHAMLRHDDVLRQPGSLMTTTGLRAMHALLEGRFAEAEQLALEALTIGQQTSIESVAGVFGVQMFTLRREQGRLQEVESAVRH